jgi:hypothetical protein
MSGNSLAVDSSQAHEARMNSPSSSANNSFAFHENTKQWFQASLMAASLVINIVLSIVIVNSNSRLLQEEDLKRYDLDFFKQNDWATLKTQVDTQEKMIQAYGLQKAVRDAARER